VYVIAASLSCDTSQNLEVETIINEELQTDQHIESKNVVNIGTKVGNQIPDFTIVYEDGTEITSASLIANGKPVFMFFAATWCPSCTRDLHELKEIYPEF
jgi:thiol-disulfide isomerase/thioredoxin